MFTKSLFRKAVAILATICILTAATACGAPGEPEAIGTTPAADAAEIPASVLAAREAVLEFLREGANECVPPRQASWTADAIADPPAGYDVYRFHSGGCAMTITVPQAAADNKVYHVALGDGASGFCWQAVVDGQGQVLLTGDAAQTDPTIGNPAQLYCEEQGHTFEIFTSEAGQLCGKCTFEDGRSCNAWAYFHGACTPENAPVP